MKKNIPGFFKFTLLPLSLILIFGCAKEEKKPQSTDKTTSNTTTVTNSQKSEPVVETKKDPAEFVPEGYKIFDKSFGDLNKDGAEDCILIIKKVDPANIITDEYRGKLDRNRRGIIVLFKKGQGYELASKNETCFSSENEEGGVYYAPELDVYAEKGKLYIHYAHGRYGYWTYTFRYGSSDFELIGYDDSSNTGPRVNSTTSINFLTGKQLDKSNVNEGAEGGDEVFEDSWKKLKTTKLMTLSEIKDFDELDFYD
ncbi:hypothetical protein [Chryseobacterium sp. OV279]|uniref:hypothetical protein n=1 Tax=Chryseobacterium sp. OV279 TaxID=1500285 RepID=UPI0009111A1D|nr:hypothetical protein [Chryseobacterium sp. OV279]SHF77052.1 hypothetical protein SAMN02787100_2546 [Chryseobacterium sp. OV279]